MRGLREEPGRPYVSLRTDEHEVRSGVGTRGDDGDEFTWDETLTLEGSLRSLLGEVSGSGRTHHLWAPCDTPSCSAELWAPYDHCLALVLLDEDDWMNY